MQLLRGGETRPRPWPGQDPLAGWNDRDIELQVAESNRQKSMTSFFQEYALKVQNEDVQTSTEPAAPPAPDHINIPACDYRIDMEQN